MLRPRTVDATLGPRPDPAFGASAGFAYERPPASPWESRPLAAFEPDNAGESNPLVAALRGRGPAGAIRAHVAPNPALCALVAPRATQAVRPSGCVGARAIGTELLRAGAPGPRVLRARTAPWSITGGTTTRPLLRAYDAVVFAAVNWLFVVLQIPWTLPPAPMNSAADARATNAMSRVYSIKS